MTAPTVERRLLMDPTVLRPATRQSPPRQATSDRMRTGRGTGRAASPQARPANPVEAPGVRRPRPSASRSCAVAPVAPVAIRSVSVRLTDRGIATVLVVMAMIAVAAVSVVALTAIRVTSVRFSPTTLVASQLLNG